MVNVYGYGATGDGTTDDTEAIQHAIDDGDGVLEFSKGSFRISRPLVLDLSKQGYGAIRGEGGTTRIVMTGPGPAFRILGDHQGTAQPSSYKEATWEKERFPTVTGIEVLGAHPEAIGIELRKTTKANITGVLVRQCKYGVHLVERNRDFILADSHLMDNHHYGLFLDQCNLHQIIVHGNHISYNKKGGIRSLDGDVHNLQITGNDIEYNNHPGHDTSEHGEPTGAEIWFEATNGVISEVTIASNTIQATIQPGGANVRIHGDPSAEHRSARLVTIAGNVLGSQRRGIELKHAQRIAIAGNTIYSSDELSIDADNCTGIAVGANTFMWRVENDAPPRDGIRFTDCGDSALTGLVMHRLGYGTPDRGGAVTLVRCHDIAVGECQILDSLVRGVEMIDCVRCRVSGNSIIDRSDPVSMVQAVRVSGSSRDNLIQNNLLGGARDRLIAASDGTAIIKGNTELD